MRCSDPTPPLADSLSILRLPDVLRRTGLKKTTLYALIAAGKFPKQIALTDRCVGWDSKAVSQFIADRIAAGGSNHG